MPLRPKSASLLDRALKSFGGRNSTRRRTPPLAPRRLGGFQTLEERDLFAIGDLDPSFSSDGKAVYAFDLGGSKQDAAGAVAVDHNGKIVVVGSVQRNATGNFDFGVVRYNTDGSIDNTFGTSGRQVIAFDFGGGLEDTPTSVAIDSANRIVIAGYVQRSSPGDYDFGVVRLSSSGALDTSFSSDGKAAVPFDIGGSHNDRATGVAVDAFDRIVVVGFAQISSSDYDFAVARLSQGGALDSTFGTGGIRTTGFDNGGSNIDLATGVAIDGSGRIVVSGRSQFSAGGDYDFAVARYTSAGALDTSFSGDGKATVHFDLGGTDEDGANSVAIDSQGRIVLAGYAIVGTGDSDFAIARLTSSGALDTSFSSDGKVTVPFNLGPSGSRADEASHVLVDRANRIVAVGSTQRSSAGDIDFAAVRLKSDGSLDTQFSGDGKAVAAFDLGGANADVALGAAFDRNGQLVMAGSTQRSSAGDFDFAVARILANRAPVAVNDFYVIGSSSSISVSAAQGALANDSDPDGDPLFGYDSGTAAHGVASANGDGSFTYAPDASFKGIDRVTYSISDGGAVSNTATVTLLSHDASIVRKFYLEVLVREPDDGGLEYWTGLVGQGAPFSAIFAGFYNSDERLNPIITKFYLDFLLRPVEADGLAYWKQQYINSGGPELTIAGMISSPEFFQSAGGTNQSYIEQLYVRLLGRSSDPGGLDYWTNLLDSNNLGRADVVLYFQYSDENRRLLINQWHQLYLGRPATDNELDLYLTQMKSGVSQRQVQMTLIDTLEYRSSPATPGAGSATRIV